MIEYRECSICHQTKPYNILYFVKRVKGFKNVCCECEDIARGRIEKERILWKQNRELALQRDNYKCTMCGSIKQLHVHHIIRRANGGTSELSNLTTLCKHCHAIVHNKDEHKVSQLLK